MNLWAATVRALVVTLSFVSPVIAATDGDPQTAWNAYRAALDSGADPGDIPVAARAVADAARNGHIQQYPAWSLVIVRDADRLLKRGAREEAIELAQIASSLAPELPSPHIWLASALLSGPSPDALASGKEWVAAFNASYRDFWSLLYRIDRWAAAAVLSLLSVTVVVILVLVIRVIPLLAHLFVEWSGHRIFRPTAWLAAGWLLITPIAMVQWSAWYVMVPGAALWWFLARRERMVLGGLAALGILASLLIPRVVPILTSDENAEFRLVVDVAEGRDPAAALADAEIVDSADGAVARATALMRAGRTDEALTLFQEALVRWPNDPRLLTGYGNTLFRRHDYGHAISAYEKALAVVPNAVPVLYNLSQAYRADLKFEEGEVKYQAARAINAGLLDRYGELSSRGADFAVVDYPTTTKELLTDAIRSPAASPVIQGAVTKVARHVSPTATIEIAVLFAACWGLGRWFPSQAASPCEICGGAICRRCQRYFLDVKLCTACWKSYARNVKLAPRSTLPQVLRRWDVRRRVAAVLSVIPGAGHALLGRPFWGVPFALAGWWVLWIGILQDVSWNTADARIVPAPWYVMWGPVVGGFVVIGLFGARHLLTMNWTPAASSLPESRR